MIDKNFFVAFSLFISSSKKAKLIHNDRNQSNIYGGDGRGYKKFLEKWK
jgi:hypothetical protein